LPDELQEGEAVFLVDLCNLFHRLLLGFVPEGTPVFCIADGISSYEFDADTYGEDYRVVMDAFGRIVQDQRMRGLFKLLLTSPTVSRGPEEYVPHQRVMLRSGRAGGGSVRRSLHSAFGSGAGLYDG